MVTVGADAGSFGPVAKVRGCHVETFDNPYDAGRYVQRQLEDKAVVLVKGGRKTACLQKKRAKILLNNPEESAISPPVCQLVCY